ncbi:RagB/SusD family nutrient uptake outer membrane protein [Pontibacter sp. 172403-2]|uniref:RagB/SusD family nutrient uptake outer membrane protein n=1 Tax=Pontibacter rufus TaxID=2791028 RepID=UPI0018AF878B|nr:RagB/SusD family nutrient uptake outer membrane protein [Pontibacter sp. 172403-2]MBF9252265.1 RagB/SusD family nutrient uptake outer membrane protein [Pontibacter sp. 172403-2]
MKKLIGIFLILSSVLFSCKKDILEIDPLDRIAENAVWADENLIRAYHNELYNGIPHGFYIHMYSKYTDEAYNSAPCCGADLFKLNNYTPDNIEGASGGDFWGGYMAYWGRGYQYIRKINVFLEKMSAPDALQFEDREQLVAEAKFLRAFVYFNLFERYGGVPVVTQSYDLEDAGSVSFKRNSVDEVVAFIEQDLEEAIPNLPERYLSGDANYGRATQDASYALRSRVLLYAASPLFNPSNDKQKWQKAADAAAVFINNNDRGYALYPDYGKLFNRPSGAQQDEFIFTRNFTTTNGHQAPMHNIGRRYGGYGGWWASNGPSQNLVDDYDMINGEPAFTWSGDVQSINSASGYNPNHPYKNRDPRMDATIIHDSTVFRGDLHEMWIAASGDQWGYDSWKQSSDNPRSSYIMKKFMPEDGPLNWQTTYTIPWPYFRLAEIYLNYAEAKFELGDEAAAREYISKVRARVGMPPIPNSVTGENLRQRLYNERRIELAFEAHRFFDIRRWKIADVIENRPIRGMDIVRNLSTGATTYTPVQLLVKNPYQEKMNLLPIETAELRRNEELEQTPGWE